MMPVPKRAQVTLHSLSAVVLVCAAIASPRLAARADESRTAEPVSVTVNVGEPGKPISSDLIGVFFEDLNDAADGGLYAELVRNRSFEFSTADNPAFQPLTGWALTAGENTGAIIATETASPLHANNTRYAVVSIEREGPAGSVRLVNEGYGGIAVKQGQRYDFSLFARRIAGGATVAAVRLESPAGKLLAETRLPQIGDDWAQHKAVLDATVDAADARLVLIADGTGKLAIDMVSLFPQKTFRGRKNGLREDLAQAIADLKPKFMRFPGGCLVHGRDLENIYHWKETIGPVEQRKGKPNLWGYHQSLGLGYFEYFQFCEDIGATPVPVVAAGVSCQFRKQRAIPLSEMNAYVQDVLDLVEYANGPATSTWGRKRAEAGHPEPFNLRYIAIGNEDAITPAFRERFAMIYNAVKAKYPQITLIGTSGPFHSGPDYDAGWAMAREMKMDMIDDHYYVPPAWFLNNNRYYDKQPRTGTKVYLGEYAAHDTGRRSTLRAAVAEAAYLTALERNADLVQFASYAPLLGKLGRTQWNPNLIYFTNTQVVPTPSYHVQKLFGNHGGDHYLPTEVAIPGHSGPRFGTSLFLGTWDTHAEFDDVRVTRGDQVLLQQEFAQEPPASTWTPQGGRWAVTDGVYRQTGGDRPSTSHLKYTLPDGNYTLALRARKIAGSEGFLIGFSAHDEDDYYWWNLGGWGNSRHGVEKSVAGDRRPAGKDVDGRIETDRWYDIRIERQDRQVRCYLDGKLIHEFEDTGFEHPQPAFASAVRDSRSGDVILKLVNVTATSRPVRVQLNGDLKLSPAATMTVLAGDATAGNSPDAPQRVSPVTSPVTVEKASTQQLPANSLTVIRLNPAGGKPE